MVRLNWETIEKEHIRFELTLFAFCASGCWQVECDKCKGRQVSWGQKDNEGLINCEKKMPLIVEKTFRSDQCDSTRWFEDFYRESPENVNLINPSNA